MNRTIIDKYEAGGAKLARGIAGLSKDEMLWKPSADAGIGTWSIQEIVIHLMDSDLIWSTRMKSIIAEDHPIILGFDESKFVSNLFYADQNPVTAIELFDLNRRQVARILRKLPDSSFSRTGNHSERGSITLEESVKTRVQHLDHHLSFVFKKREKLGKPLKD